MFRFLDTKRTVVSVLYTLLKSKQLLLLQEFVGDGTDIRAIVVENKVVASQIRKTANKDEFRANLSLGGVGSKIELDNETKQFCVDT
ncbi:MAG: hypothetical protein U9Q83_07785 [Bacteroidota bacterium]|nr:hypothetical protein [Bacteroidota bacterium]